MVGQGRVGWGGVGEGRAGEGRIGDLGFGVHIAAEHVGRVVADKVSQDQLVGQQPPFPPLPRLLLRFGLDLESPID